MRTCLSTWQTSCFIVFQLERTQAGAASIIERPDCFIMQVAIPIPLPKGWVVADNYKIQFTYDGAA